MKVNKKLNHFKRQTQLFTLVEQVILFVFYDSASTILRERID